MNLTAEQLRSLVSYDPETGVFTRLPSASHQSSRYEGKPCGRVHKVRGYCEIHVAGKLYYAHRLAFLYMNGAWPAEEVDHINHARSDNRWSNLREVSASENQQNRDPQKTKSKSGLAGVTLYKSGNYVRWVARIQAEGRNRHIGYFKTPEAAQVAYLETKRRLHTACTI